VRPISISEKKEITIAEAKRLLEAQGENIDPLQRRVLDYTVKFSKLSAEESARLVEELTGGKFVDRVLAVQIANCMPSTIEEIRTFIGRQRIISEEDINAILKTIEKYRSN